SLKNLCVSISDGDHQAPPKSETGIPFLVISDVNKGKIDLENVSRWVPESYYLALKEIRKPSLNDILYTVTGSFGIPVVV
ncbi:restriction endonuclease subunit S, partial [Klebsiella quasipneumoniae]